MNRRFSFALLVCAGCFGGSSRGPTTAEVNQTHEHACTAKGLVLIAEGLSFGESCEQTAPRLQDLLRTDEDCLAYIGDATPSVADLCSLVLRNDPVKDAGHD